MERFDHLVPVKDLIDLSHENAPTSLRNIIETQEQLSFFINECYEHIQKMSEINQFYSGGETLDSVRNILFNGIFTLSSDDPRLENIKDSTLNLKKLFLHILTESQYLAEMNFTQHGEDGIFSSTELMDLIFSANPLSDETSIALQKIVDVVTQGVMT
jgi:hypothetical protein